jgi:hypothetical protein
LLARNKNKKENKNIIKTYKSSLLAILDKFMERIRPMPPENLGNVSKKVQI